MEPNWQLWANNDFNLYNNFISGTCSKFFVIGNLSFKSRFKLTVALNTQTEIVKFSHLTARVDDNCQIPTLPKLPHNLLKTSGGRARNKSCLMGFPTDKRSKTISRIAKSSFSWAMNWIIFTKMFRGVSLGTTAFEPLGNSWDEKKNINSNSSQIK